MTAVPEVWLLMKYFVPSLKVGWHWTRTGARSHRWVVQPWPREGKSRCACTNKWILRTSKFSPTTLLHQMNVALAMPNCVREERHPQGYCWWGPRHVPHRQHRCYKITEAKHRNRERAWSLQVSVMTRLNRPRGGKAVFAYRYCQVWIIWGWPESKCMGI